MTACADRLFDKNSCYQGGIPMSIRKTGAVTGEVTGVEQQGMAREAAAGQPWTPEDDSGLAAENEAADKDHD
jgi:hypothetical protein